jgi:cell division septation protein DedD
MRNNETGEFELVVGNRQLLSGFFIIVLLFAVAFAMGYVVGENSRSAKQQADKAPSSAVPAVNTAEARPQPADPAPSAQPPQSPPSQPADTAQPPAGDASPQPTTQPAHEAEPPAPSKHAPAKVAAESPSGELATGAYWQVIATANRDTAQAIAQTLRDKGLPAALSPGPNNLTRVLVGPYSDTASMGRAKTELEGAGFLHLSSLRK